MVKAYRIATTGASGQVGSAVLTQDPEVTKITARFDQGLESLVEELDHVRPQRLINGAAYTQVDQAESEQTIAKVVNADAVGTLSTWCKTANSELIHFSTDYIFDGQAKQPYHEDDRPSPINVYGHTKLAGEQAVQRSQCLGLIIRTSWVLGHPGRNFVTTILRAGLEWTDLQVVNDQWGRPTSAALLASIALNVEIDSGQPATMFHVTDSGEPTTWYEIACYALNRARDFGYTGLDGAAVSPIASTSYQTAARRPLNSLLDCSRFDQLIGIQRPLWKTTVDEIVEHDASNW